MATDTTTVTYRLEKAGALVLACGVALGEDGAPRFAPHAFPGLVFTGGHPFVGFVDEAALGALEAGDRLRVWAGTERFLALSEGVWRDAQGRPVAPFAALSLEGAMDADQKAWLRLDRTPRKAP